MIVAQFGNEPKGKQNRRGKTNTKSKLSGLGKDLKPTAKMTWEEAIPDQIGAVVCGVVAVGGAVMFGASRDGGAISLTIYLDGEKKTLWFNGDSDLDLEIEQVVAHFASLRD